MRVVVVVVVVVVDVDVVVVVVSQFESVIRALSPRSVIKKGEDW